MSSTLTGYIVQIDALTAKVRQHNPARVTAESLEAFCDEIGERLPTEFFESCRPLFLMAVFEGTSLAKCLLEWRPPVPLRKQKDSAIVGHLSESEIADWQNEWSEEWEETDVREVSAARAELRDWCTAAQERGAGIVTFFR